MCQGGGCDSVTNVAKSRILFLLGLTFSGDRTYRLLVTADWAWGMGGTWVHSGRSGESYDFSQRLAHPLFQDLGIDLADQSKRIEGIKKIMKANVQYCLTGQDTLFQEMLAKNNKNESTLEAYKAGYSKFFIQDFHWTNANFRNLRKRGYELKQWWSQSEPLRSTSGLFFETIEVVVFRLALDKSISNADLIEKIFEDVFERKLKPAFQHNGGNALQISRDEERARAFVRYLLGQLALFSRFHYVEDLEELRSEIQTVALPHVHSMSSVTQHWLRRYLDDAVGYLRIRSVITSDDARTYQEVFPLFDPVFLSYKVELTESLEDVSRSILGDY